MKMAITRTLAFGRAGGPGPHPTQVAVMAQLDFPRSLCYWSKACSPHPARSENWPHGPCFLAPIP